MNFGLINIFRRSLLKKKDKELYNLIKLEKKRQDNTLELIASENYTSGAVLECLGSCLTNKYSEGLPNRRYYGGNKYIDEIELLCQKRALEVYGLSDKEWGVNVQCYSGSVANLGVYLGLIKPHDTIMGLDLPSGGHLTHGFETAKKKISHTSLLFESRPYYINEEGYIDMEGLEVKANECKPNLIICGGSAYPRDWDYEKFNEISNKLGCLLMCDMSHLSGFVATGKTKSPFKYCDVVSTTTHKTLRGPRSALVFYRKKYEDCINESIFPGLQGGPHNHQIAGVATQLKEASTKEFKDYIEQVYKNTQALCKTLIHYGYVLSSGGSDCHIILLDLRSKGIKGHHLEYVCDLYNIALNKNTVYGDKNALYPSGVRIGTSAMTTKGFKEDDFIKVGEVLNDCVKVCQKHYKPKMKFVDFKEEIKKVKYNDILSKVKSLCKK
jgi:glycine hydroxymethyltransferase